MGDRPATRAASPGRPERWTVRRFATIESTNQWLLDEARGGAAAGLVAVADHQRSGRGRRGRVWEAPPGSSLLVSLLLRPQVAPDRLHTVTMAVALALADALGAVCGIDAGLKWPNDLVVGDRKIAGLLAEAELAGDKARALVVGVGCNLVQATFPDDLAAIATSCMIEAGRAPERDAMLDDFLGRVDARLADASATVVEDYRSRLSTLGREVRVDLDHGVVIGRAGDVDDCGRLVVTPASGPAVAVAVGDVVHLRPA
jgi:BirA family transcriptional regulator, biotin operon repressor / biotin---[acetyl-CoA-carboxylase] ligase